MDAREALKLLREVAREARGAVPFAVRRFKEARAGLEKVLRPEIDRATLVLERYRLEQAVDAGDALERAITFFADNYHKGKGAPELQTLLKAAEEWRVNVPGWRTGYPPPSYMDRWEMRRRG